MSLELSWRRDSTPPVLIFIWWEGGVSTTPIIRLGTGFWDHRVRISSPLRKACEGGGGAPFEGELRGTECACFDEKVGGLFGAHQMAFWRRSTHPRHCSLLLPVDNGCPIDGHRDSSSAIHVPPWWYHCLYILQYIIFRIFLFLFYFSQVS